PFSLVGVVFVFVAVEHEVFYAALDISKGGKAHGASPVIMCRFCAFAGTLCPLFYHRGEKLSTKPAVPFLILSR
ncbi:MAG: hypothetical protein PUA83_02040, partial [Clostridiales bacterium]|nr:hypothetical protein [Clostridiales bacterium]